MRVLLTLEKHFYSVWHGGLLYKLSKINVQGKFYSVIKSLYSKSSCSVHCQKLGTRWRLRVRTKATMAANSYKKMYGEKETFSNISILSSRVFGARLETC